MAIIYDIGDNVYLKPAHNNFILSFYSNTLTSPNHAIVSVNGVDLKYSPNLNSQFKINLKELIKSIANKNLFEDDKNNYSLPNDFILKGGSVYLVSIQIAIYQGASVDNITIPIRVYNGVRQLYDDDTLNIPINGFDLMYNKYINGNYFIYNDGYPFDIEFYINETLGGALNSAKIENFTTGEVVSINFSNFYNFRLCLCDGKTDVSILNLLILENGDNKIKITLDNSPLTTMYFTIHKKETENGTYFKWINEFGAWSYWLFDCFNEIKDTITKLGSLQKDFYPIEKTISPTPSYGVRKNSTLKVNTGIISKEYYGYFKSIFNSPKIYLYTGERFSQKTFTQWVEVSIDGDYNIKQPKGMNYNFDIEFNLGSSYSMTI